MKKTTVFLFTALWLISFNSCKKDPLGCASSDKSAALTDESITFTSCSENSERISWDFGDGTTEEGNSVSHAYAEAGTYLVKMIAYSKKDKDWDKTSMIVTISEPPAPAKRYLAKVVLKSFAQKTPNNDEWDNDWFDTSGPDVFVTLKLSSDEWSINTSTITDADASDVPKTWGGYAPQNIYLSDENWAFEIRDSDNLGSSSELMNAWTINPATNSAAGGVISLSTGSYSLDIYFEER